jgi:hypothetical protein
LNALEDLGAIKGATEVREAEGKVVVAAVQRLFVVLVERRADPVGQGHRARRALRLGGRELTADEALAHTPAAGQPVHVAPAQPEQLALAQPGQGDRAADRARATAHASMR